MRKNVVIVHYNTPKLTALTIRSLNKVTDDCNIYVFDNSDKEPFTCCLPNVTIIDNTRGQVVDFDEMLAQHPDRMETRSNHGSAKHCKSVDCCLDMFNEGFLLVDSDVLVMRDVSSFFNDKYAWVGGVHCNTHRFGVEVLRVIPYLCYINVGMLREHGIRYYNPEKMWFLNNRKPDMFYDTGAWLYEVCEKKRLPHKTVVLSDYALHFRHGSWKEKDAEAWLNDNKKLWI